MLEFVLWLIGLLIAKHYFHRFYYNHISSWHHRWRHNKIKTKGLRCPECGTRLQKDGEARLQSLDEHVCCQNATPSMKDIYRCPNKSCATVGMVKWTEEGEVYSDYDWDSKEEFREKYDQFKSLEKKHNGLLEALGGVWRGINARHEGRGYEYRKRRQITLPKWFPWIYSGMVISLDINYDCDADGVEQNILNRSYVFQSWIPDENGISMTGHTSGLHMLKYCISKFHGHYFSYLVSNKKRKEWLADQMRSSFDANGFRSEWWRYAEIYVLGFMHPYLYANLMKDYKRFGFSDGGYAMEKPILVWRYVFPVVAIGAAALGAVVYA